MKRLLVFYCFLFANPSFAWQAAEDSLMGVVRLQKKDKAYVDALVLLGRNSQQPATAFRYLQEGILQAKKINYPKGEADCYLMLEKIYAQQGNFSQAIQSNLDALAIYQRLRDYTGMASAHGMLQAVYREISDYSKSLVHAFASLQIAETHQVKGDLIFPGHRWATLMLAEIGQTYVLKNQLDSARLYTTRAIQQKELFNGTTWEFPIYLLATILNKQGQYEPALERYREALALCEPNGNPWDTLQVYSGTSTLFKNQRKFDSAIHYAKSVVQGWRHPSEFKNLLEATTNLAHIYKANGNVDSALAYLELSHDIRDSIFSAEKDREVQRIAFSAKLREEEIKAEQIQYKSKVQLFVFLAGSLALLAISGLLMRSNQQKQKAKAKIQKAYTELKTTQAQLIQREKMASLGELTAGIAHEIQNPLNFVNNFSEVSKELVEELKQEAEQGNTEGVATLADDVLASLDKVMQHGKRADAIVKNMLQHSKATAGEKALTDINVLTEGYLRLAFHGYQSNNKNFSAVLETHFDENLPPVNLVPQEVGRVLLNLFNNAFYAVAQKKAQRNGTFEPVVSVSTKQHAGRVEVRVNDNGTGIPQKNVDKIFQPFFTTKPTGQGTGLGLSLSYDIVANGHGGELSVESKEGEGTTFIVLLPFQNPKTIQ